MPEGRYQTDNIEHSVDLFILLLICVVTHLEVLFFLYNNRQVGVLVASNFQTYFMARVTQMCYNWPGHGATILLAKNSTPT